MNYFPSTEDSSVSENYIILEALSYLKTFPEKNLTLVIRFISLLSQNRIRLSYEGNIKKCKYIHSIEEITFTYYRIIDGKRNTLIKIKTVIEHLLPKAEYIKSQQLSMLKR